MAEYIEKKIAIDAIYERQFKEHCRNYAVDDDPIYERYLAYRDAMAIVKDLPSADVAPVKHGEWIPYIEEDYIGEGQYGYIELLKCSECGTLVPNKRNFCPNCGAKMRCDG